MLVSMLMLTWNRYDITKLCLSQNIFGAGTYLDIELLVCDQGSGDKRIIDFVKSYPCLAYHRLNSKNEGVGRAFNQLYLRAKGDYIVLLGNDIENDPGWMDAMVRYAQKIPNSGIIGLDWGHSGMPPLCRKFGLMGHWLTPQLNRIFGTWLMRREVIDRTGFFPENYDVYGLEDSSMNERVNRFGFNSVYLPNTEYRSHHLGVGPADASEYREMKNQSMQKNLRLYQQNVADWDMGLPLYEKLPEQRDPI